MSEFEMQLAQFLYGQCDTVSLVDGELEVALPDMCYYCRDCSYIASRGPCERCGVVGSEQ